MKKEIKEIEAEFVERNISFRIGSKEYRYEFLIRTNEPIDKSNIILARETEEPTTIEEFFRQVLTFAVETQRQELGDLNKNFK